MEEYVEKLSRREIKPTALRLLIFRAMAESDHAVSLTELEDMLETVDKSTIFRTVMLFLSHHLIHGIADGSGTLKYAICSNDCRCGVEELHTHFYCERCHKTFCLKGLPAPIVKLPEGFSISSVNYVMKGVCPSCSGNQTLE